MALAVVQTLSVQQSLGGSFASNVTAGNSIIIALSSFTTSSATLASVNPTFNALPVTGAVLLVHAQSTTSGTNQVYGAIWLLPNVTGGAKPIAYSMTGSPGSATAIGFTAWEVSGLGATPSLDQFISGNGATGTTLSSGTTPAITAAPEFIAVMACSFGNAIAKAGVPWTEVNSAGGADTIEGQQIVTSSGGTFSYAPVAAGSAGWVSMIATIQGTGGAATPPFVASGRTVSGRRAPRRGASAGSPAPEVRIEEIPPAASGRTITGRRARKGTSAGSPRPLLHIEEIIPATGRTITGRKARKGTSAGSPAPLRHIEDVPPVSAGTTVRGRPGKRGSAQGSKPVPVAAAPPPVIQPPAAAGASVRGKRARKGTAAGSPAPLLHVEEIVQALGRAVTGKRARKGTAAGSRAPLPSPAERIQLLPLGRAVAGRKARRGAAAGSKPVPVRAAPPVTVVSPLSATMTLTNGLGAVIEDTSVLSGTIDNTSELGGLIWQ